MDENIIDMQKFALFIDLLEGETCIAEMLLGFFDEVSRGIEDLETAAVNAQDIGAVKFVCRQLKASSGYVGAFRLSLIFSEVEYYAGIGNLENVIPLIDRLRNELSLVRKELSEYLR